MTETLPPEEAAWDSALRQAFRPEDEAQRAVAESVLANLPLAAGDVGVLRLRPLGKSEEPGPVLARCAEIDLRSGRIGRLQLQREIARGGVGVILEAFDPDLGRRVAVKVLREELAGHFSLVQRFVEEAQIGGQLQHPGIIPVHELGLDPTGRPYFAMRLVEGRTLASLLAAQPDPAAQRARRLDDFEKLCQTLAYAHARGVVHRDLKPGNIMIGTFGEVLVLDWGFAKILERIERTDDPIEERVHTLRSQADAPPSMPGDRLGTPAYMSPEQERGEREAIDERTDVWALGALLFELLSGEVWNLSGASTEPHSIAARLAPHGVERDLVELVERCLAEEREQRPRHAGDLAAALAQHRARAESRARAAETAAVAANERAAADRRTRRLVLLLAAALIAIVGGVAFWYADGQARRSALAEKVDLLVGHAERALDAGDFDKAREELLAADTLMRLIDQPRADRRRRVDTLMASAQRSEQEWVLDRELIRLATTRAPLDQVDEQLAALFETLKLEVEDADMDEYAGLQVLEAEFPERRPELARALFARAHRDRGPASRVKREELVEWCDRLDPEPARVALRRAVRSARQLELALKELKLESLDFETKCLVAEAYRIVEDRPRALELLEPLVAEHPDELWPRWLLLECLPPRAGPEGPRRELRPSREWVDGHAKRVRELHPDGQDPLGEMPRRGGGARGPGPHGPRQGR